MNICRFALRSITKSNKFICVPFSRPLTSVSNFSEPTAEGEPSIETADDNLAKARQFWKENNIKVFGKDAPLPVFDFRECNWPERIKNVLEEDGFEKPTPIQSQGWPIVLAGKDMVGIAQTGSGKTLCYVLPAFVNILKRGPQRGPQCLVLAPTRELAQQIQTVVKKFRVAHSACLFGGVSRNPQIKILREVNPQIVIATPGRINDFLESRIIDLSSVDYLVLDEADRMLDMGFEPQIRSVIRYVPEERQTLMWSATWPKEVRELASDYMQSYIQINVGGTELVANKNIKQIVLLVEPEDKYDKLIEILKKYPQTKKGENKILIFTGTKRAADDVCEKLKLCGKAAVATHGDKSQSQRDFIMSEFRSGRFAILCATDVAARGLDVDDIKVVINYDYPQTAEDYVHRIGRTGRCNNLGMAYTLFTEEDRPFAKDLVELLKNGGQEVDPQLEAIAQTSQKGAQRRFRGPAAPGPFGGFRGGPRNNNNYNRQYQPRNYGDYFKPDAGDYSFQDERSRMKDKLWKNNYSIGRKINYDEEM